MEAYTFEGMTAKQLERIQSLYSTKQPKYGKEWVFELPCYKVYIRRKANGDGHKNAFTVHGYSSEVHNFMHDIKLSRAMV